METRWRCQQASTCATSHAHQLRASCLQHPLHRPSWLAGCRKRSRSSQKFQNGGKFLVVELDHRCPPRGVAQHFRSVKSLPQVHIEYSNSSLGSRIQKVQDRFARRGRTLRQRAIRNGGSLPRQRSPLRGHFKKVPRNRPGNFVLRLSAGIEPYLHRSRRMIRIRLEKIRRQAKMLEPAPRFLPERVRSQTAGNNAMISQQAGNIGKVCRRAAKLPALRKQIPEEFAETYNGEIASSRTWKRSSRGHLAPRSK